MHFFPRLFGGILVCTAFSAELKADWEDKVKNAWDTTKDVGKGVLDSTATVGKKAIDATEQVGGKAVTAAKEWITADQKAKDRTHFEQVWERVIGKLDQALAVNEKMEQVPDSSLFGPDKVSVRKDFNDILSEILTILEDQRVSALMEGIRENRRGIVELEALIQQDKEARITAPVEHVVKTTKVGHDQRIKQSQESIADHRKEIFRQKEQLLARLQEMGITLTSEQMDVLMVRVDSEDILQMAAIFDILKQVTRQLMTLTQESGENLQAARRYYGMHMVLLESVVYMQKKYIDQVERRYVVGIMGITDETTKLAEETQQNLRRAEQPQHRSVYEQNLKALNLTLKTARVYLQNLKLQRQKVEQALDRSMKDLNVAQNTYHTVRLSSQLMDLLQIGQQSFDAIMGLQIPEIVPFENLEMHKKYEEISLRLAGRQVSP